MELSKRQQDVYDCIDRYRKKNGISPSMADIAKELGLARTTINSYVDLLIIKGRVSKLSGIPRSLKTIKPAV